MNKTKVFSFIALIIYSTFAYKISCQEYNSSNWCNKDSILREINIPLIEIWTNDTIEPSGTNITAPEGLWGTGLINNEYVAYMDDIGDAYQYHDERDLYNSLINCIEWLIKEGYFPKEYLV